MLQVEDGPNRKVSRSRKRSSGSQFDNLPSHVRSGKFHKTDVFSNDKLQISELKQENVDQRDCLSRNELTNRNEVNESKKEDIWFANSFVRERRNVDNDLRLAKGDNSTVSTSSRYFSQSLNRNIEGSDCSCPDQDGGRFGAQENYSVKQMVKCHINNNLNGDCLSSGNSVLKADMSTTDKGGGTVRTSTPQKNKGNTKNVDSTSREMFSSGDSILDNSDMWLADLDMQVVEEGGEPCDQTKSKDVCVKQVHCGSKVPENKPHVDQADDDLFENSFSEEDFLEQIKCVDISTDKKFQSVKTKDNDNLRTRDFVKKQIGIGELEQIQTRKSLVTVKNHGETDTVRIDNNQNAIPKTPAGSNSGSLRDRIKKRLQENVGTTTPKTPGSLIQQMREEVLQRAQNDAERLQKEYADVDIGPFYGLPTKVQQLLERHRGIKKLYDWQEECLRLPAVLNCKNLIYSLPTSGGKTLVAEILILRELLCKKKDALLILPFVSIVQEKVRNMSHFAVDLDFLVEEYAGSKGKFPPVKRRKKKSLYIATIEKGHSLINSLTDQGRLESVGLVVVDELHMIGEGGSRGATLESSLLKIIHSQNNTQIIGMSATLNNIEDLQQFIQAEVYSNDFRPVTLTEYVKLQDNIFEVQSKAKCSEDLLQHDRVVTFQYTSDMAKVDTDYLFGLVMEVIPDNSCLLFCPTKKNCENVALMLCKLIVKHKKELSNIKKTERKALLKELYTDGDKRICPVLQYTIHFGVAYHHSGLTTDERKLIEEAYSDGILCLLTCTSTLAAGVNLPAKRVILRCPFVGSKFISRSQYKQMVGRAGRAGIDTSGESILITKLSDMEKVGELLSGPVESCYSSLMYDDGKGIRNLLLSAIGLQITPTTSDVFSFMSKTLLSVQSSQKSCSVTDITKDSLQKLINLGLVVQKKVLSQDNCSKEHCLEVSPLGKATFKGSVDLDCATQLYKDLKKAEESLFLSSHLHLLFLVTPYDMATTIKPSWTIYFQQMNTLSPVELKVAGLIGVPESYITKKASGQVIKQTVDDLVVSRFYLTLMLFDLWKQKSIWEVSENFQQPRGFIQNLLSSSASFASCVHHFCQELEEFWAYQDLLGNFVKRLAYCVTAELIPLMEIPGVKLGRAKQLYSAGYKSLSLVAHADPENIVKTVKQIPKRVAMQIVASAKILLNEKAEALWEEVEELVSVPENIPIKTPVASSQGSETYSLNSSPSDSQFT